MHRPLISNGHLNPAFSPFSDQPPCATSPTARPRPTISITRRPARHPLSDLVAAAATVVRAAPPLSQANHQGESLFMPTAAGMLAMSSAKGRTLVGLWPDSGRPQVTRRSQPIPAESPLRWLGLAIAQLLASSKMSLRRFSANLKHDP
jgi:hypothetical protein